MMVRHPRMGFVRMSRDRLTGDPGLWGFLGKLGKGILHGLGGVVKSQLGFTDTTGVPKLPGVPQLPIPPFPGQGGKIPGRKSGPFKFPGGPFPFAPGLGGGAGGKRHRRMRATNVKALRRALRRVHGFERVARKVLRISTGRPVRVRFRKHRRRVA
jgi:hypothetical protein